MKLLLPLLFLLGSASAVKDCPLLGRDFPIPTKLNSATIQNATSVLRRSIETFLQDGTLENVTSSFSVEIFSPRSNTSLFSYHHSSPVLNATEGVSVVDENTIYRIGSISKLFSVYVFLIEAGDRYLNEPITRFVPELAGLGANGEDEVEDVDWESITVGSLASHMSGIGRDYLFDLQLVSTSQLLSLGFPPNETALPACIEKGVCTRKEFFALFPLRHPVYPSSTTPIYNNVAYQLLAYALENITGRSFSQMLETDLIAKLGLNSTSYKTPNSTQGAIPFNASYSSWGYDLGDLSPAGNMYSTTHDLALLGRSILSSTLLSPAQTRRWMKPLTHTSDPMVSVGAPWEILRLRLPSTSRIVDLYTKDGEIGLYESQFALAPDWDIGIVVFQAGLSYNARVIANLIADVLFPALEDAAREEADAVYTGTYAIRYVNSTVNSSMIITTDPQKPGLGISSWVSNGTDVPTELTTAFLFNNTDVRLYPTGLVDRSSGKESWRAVFGTKQTLGGGIFSQTCTTWGLVDNYRFGGKAMDEFVFVLKEGKAESVEPMGFGAVLQRQKGG